MCFFLAVFFDLTYTHTPGIGRKRLLHIIATVPLNIFSLQTRYDLYNSKKLKFFLKTIAFSLKIY